MTNSENTNLSGIYIHVPFCQSRCIYCDFYSTVYGEDFKDRYVERLLKEMADRKNEVDSHVDTIYVGGGTPSCLHTGRIEKMMNHLIQNFSLADNPEITLEANPDDVTPSFVKQLVDIGINRVSLGVQTFDDECLRFIRRRHSSHQAVKAVHSLVENGIDNVSIDLIFGFPNESVESWEKDLKQALSLPVKHLSAYSLMFEEGTLLTHMRDGGQIDEIDEDLSLRMYDVLLDMTEKKGMEHYEISNFSYPGFRSHHNSKYWMGAPYVGFGPGAHSFNGVNVRRSNNSDLKSYIQSSDEVPHEIEILGADELCDEFVFTSLRTKEGLDTRSLLARFGIERFNKIIVAAEAHVKSGLLKETSGHLSFTHKGFFLSDLVMSDMMIVE